MHVFLWGPQSAWMPETGTESSRCPYRGSPPHAPRTQHESLPLLLEDHHREWAPALGGLWEAPSVGRPGIGETSAEKLFLMVKASKL